MNEKQLIAQLKEGNPDAFRELVEQLKNKVFNTALGILQNAEDAEDISQEVFVEVFQSIKQFKGDAKLTTWVYRITFIKSLEFLRKKKSKKRFAFVQSLFKGDTITPVSDKPHFHHPGVQLENKEQAAILFKAIEQLPGNQKTAFVLHKLEGLSYTEIQDIMRVSLSSVESLLFRAKQNLQKLLQDYYNKNKN